ncbi:LOW QUALITY PROTEIN: cilia- and flagella-associated protein 45-like [Aphelocoma coerulescens]|uniref:LOW QUALITY PROTEIN: cilia- and flagella-associated protein 45-like n=1 Tax=Aphelocoma coerulescens TaxID=39617 RepID=UPI003604931A
MAAATAGTGSRSLRAGGSSRRSLLARRLQLSPPGFQSVRPDVSPLGSRAPQLPHTPRNVHLLPLTPGPSVPSGRAPPTAPRPIRAEFPELPPGSVGVRGTPGGGFGSSDFSFLQVTGSSNPIVISQDVPKHPRDRPSLKPKLKTIRIITKDLIRDLIIPQEKPQPCLIIGKKEYEKIKESAQSPTEEERWDRLKTLKARQDAAFETLKKAQSEELRKAELQNEREHLSDLEEEKEQQERQKLLQRAMRMRLEQEEEMRELTSLFLNSKCNMIRDKQILEKRMIRKELAEEEKRLDKMMEMEWEKGVAVQEELERQRKQEMMRARQDLVKQMEQNAEKRALRDEEKYQEGQKLLECLEQMKREDRKAWEQKQERHRQIHAEIQYFNVESQRLKDEQRERERLEDERVLEQQRQKAEREAALEAEQEQLRLEKEKELARLRAAQERARDWQAERDALMAKRNQEAADREWRRQELENARKKVELEQQLRRDRLEQVAQKEQYLAMQVEQDRQEFQRVLRAHQEQLEREKLQREQRELQQRAHAEDLRRQIQELRQQRERERAAFIEEGRQQEQEVRQRNRRLAQLGQQKLQEFRATGMPDKYCAQVERKAQRRANAALS